MLDTLLAVTIVVALGGFATAIWYRELQIRTMAQLEALVRLARKVGVSDAAIAGLVTGAMPYGLAPFEVLKALDKERPHDTA